jgi:hypothetical protein
MKIKFTLIPNIIFLLIYHKYHVYYFQLKLKIQFFLKITKYKNNHKIKFIILF